MAKPKHKKKYDFGGQTIVEINGQYYRLPDFEEVVVEIPKVEKDEEAFKRVRKRHADIFEYYYNNHLLYPDNHNLNNDLYNAGLRIQQDIYYAGYYPSITFNYVKERIIGDSDKSLISKLGAQDRVRGALRKAGEYSSIIYEVIVNNHPAKSNIDKFRKGLFRLCDYYEI